MHHIEWAFGILESDRKLGRPTTAEDLGPLSKSQQSARRKAVAEAGDDPAVAAIYAQVPVLEELLGVKLHVDHILPVSRGGKHTANNLQIVPASVNLKKNDKIHGKYEEFA